MKSNLTPHMNNVNFEVVRKQEIEDILEWLDTDLEYYERFLYFQQIKNAQRQAEQDWASGQDPTYELGDID